MNKKIKFILALGIAIRLFLAATTYHSDIQPYYFAGDLIAKGNVGNLYDYLGSLSPDNQLRHTFPPYYFNYPPLLYFTLGPTSYVMSLPFDKDFLWKYVITPEKVIGDMRLNAFLLLLKLPYLFFDLAIAWCIYKFFSEPKSKVLGLALWMFNPFNLFATYMMGIYDILPTFFVIVALYMASKKDAAKASFTLEAVLLGLGASFKIFPFLFFVPLALLKDTWTGRIKILAVGLFTYFLTILPFLSSSGYRTNALIAGQTLKSFYANIPVSGGEFLYLFLLAIVFVYCVFLYSKNSPSTLWGRMFIPLLIFFIFTHWHLQWMLWLSPFLVIDLVKSKMRHFPLVLGVLVSFIALDSFFDPGLNVWLFAPLIPSLYKMPSIWHQIGIVPDETFFRGIFQTSFAAIAAFYIYYHFPSIAKHEA